MSGMKRGAWVASTLMLVAILVSACNQPYSQPPVVTNTPIDPNSLFATPFGGATGLNDVQIFASQTARAANPLPPAAATPTGGIVLTPQSVATTPSPIVSLLVSPTVVIPTSTLAIPAGVSTSTPAPSGPKPPTYTLQQEEFPFCIARRYGIDPGALLNASQLASPDIYYAGLVLTIPSGPAWSVQDLGPLELRPHPATYVVTGNADTTVYGVACKFGNVQPDAIVKANGGLTLNSTLNVGQSLNIP